MTTRPSFSLTKFIVYTYQLKISRCFPHVTPSVRVVKTPFLSLAGNLSYEGKAITGIWLVTDLACMSSNFWYRKEARHDGVHITTSTCTVLSTISTWSWEYEHYSITIYIGISTISMRALAYINLLFRLDEISHYRLCPTSWIPPPPEIITRYYLCANANLLSIILMPMTLMVITTPLLWIQLDHGV